MRNAFIDELVCLGEQKDNIALVVGDLGYGVVEPFAERFPNRFFNAGVAEQNMMGLAAGLASEGMHVFVYSIANFPTFRCAEQIRNDVDYHQLPVTVVAVGGGLAYGNLGYSHHAVQDYALLRSLPNMLIAAPGDPMEARACMRYLVEHPQPSYLRLGKAGEPSYHRTVPVLQPGQWLPVREARSELRAGTFLTTGGTLQLAHEACDDPRLQGWGIHSMPLWSMQSKLAQRAQLESHACTITVEDHLPDGGFGSWLMEAVAGDGSLLGRLRSQALSSAVCGMVGKQGSLNAAGGLNHAELIRLATGDINEPGAR